LVFDLGVLNEVHLHLLIVVHLLSQEVAVRVVAQKEVQGDILLLLHEVHIIQKLGNLARITH